MIPQEYINKDGIVTVQPLAPHIPGDGNGILQTGLAYACGEYPEPERLPLILAACRVSMVCPLIWRSPWKRNQDDNQKQDDYHGALLFSPEWAKDLLFYAEAMGWDFSIHPWDTGKLDYAFDRFLDFPPMVRAAANARLSLVDKIIVFASMLLRIASIGSADGNMKSFCFFTITQKKVFLGDVLFSYWKKRVVKKYGSIGGGWAAYFGPNHPLSNYNP